MDGEKEHHDLSVCKEGGYEIALEAIREAVKRGFRVTTNTTIFDGVSSKSVRAFFTQMMDAGVEGMMISPGYSYDKAPDQQHFTGRELNQSMFRKILSNRDPRWQFNMSPLFLEFLMGKRNLRMHALGDARATASSAGRSPATCCRMATRTRSRSCLTPRNGRITATNRAIPSAPIACCTPATRLPRSITRFLSKASSPPCAPCCSPAIATPKPRANSPPRNRNRP